MSYEKISPNASQIPLYAGFIADQHNYFIVKSEYFLSRSLCDKQNAMRKDQFVELIYLNLLHYKVAN